MPEPHEKRRRPQPLLYNRETNKCEEELVYKKWFMDLFYRTAPGRTLASTLLNRRCVSRLYGALKRRPRSSRNIRPFVMEYRIDTDEIDGPLSGFRSFNDFFTRKLKPSTRPVERNRDALIAPADSRLLALEVKNNTVIPVKSGGFTLRELLQDAEVTQPFSGGLCLKFRLAPADYHRFCYIEDGYHGPITAVGGVLNSVNQIALEHKSGILCENYREYCVLHTKHFGPVIHIDVGSLLVGSIHQNLRNGGIFRRGQEKGYFELGGSTIIILLKPGVAAIDQDIVDFSKKGIETIVKYGSRIGYKAARGRG